MKIADILDLYSNSEWVTLIDEWVKSERDRRILRRWIVDGITIERIAEEIDMSPRQTSRIIQKWCAVIVRKAS